MSVWPIFVISQEYRWDEDKQRMCCFAQVDTEYSNQTQIDDKKIKENEL